MLLVYGMDTGYWEMILLRIFIEERTGEIPRTISQEKHSIGDDFLRMSYISPLVNTHH